VRPKPARIHPARKDSMLARIGTTLVAVTSLAASAGVAQDLPRPEDVASPEAAILAAYASIARAPGEDYDWARFRSLHLPGALLLPNTEQTGGEPVVWTVDEFVAAVDQATDVGGEQDRGFAEEQVHITVNRYGDIAQAMSTYQKHYWDDDQILGRGINSFNLAYREGRWWIVSIAWDEENGAGPIPEAYLPRM
jgi:hypothetical protein